MPATARLHEPAPIELTVRNRHAARSAVVSVTLDPQPNDGFVVAGLRQGRLPLVLAGAEERMRWHVVPIECGYVRVPRVRVWDHRREGAGAEEGQGQGQGQGEGQGEVVRVVDVRFERWGKERDAEHTILVLP